MFNAPKQYPPAPVPCVPHELAPVDGIVVAWYMAGTRTQPWPPCLQARRERDIPGNFLFYEVVGESL